MKQDANQDERVFDLEKAISGWRRRLEQRRTFSHEDIDELESHLRDQIDASVTSGTAVRSAYYDALHRIGAEEEVETEYRKTRWAKARHRRESGRVLATEMAMIANYVKLAFRNLLRNPGYALINIGGLGLGIAACIVILLFVLYETSYDRHNDHADRIYRVTREWFDENDQPVMHLARISIPIGPAMQTELPEVERAVRLWEVETPVSNGDRQFMESNLFLADSSYSDLFSQPVLSGKARGALGHPNTALITPAVAERYFGDRDPIGESLVLFGSTSVEVAAIVADAPARSHVHPEILVSFSTGEAWLSEQERSAWGMFNNFATYLLLTPDADPAALEAKLPSFLRSHYEPENNSRDILRLQPLTDIHLRSSLDAEIEPNGNITYVYLFGAVAFFVLLIACFNFVNLATARSMFRSREVGVRKVLGAEPGQIVRQFLGEAVLLATLATMVAAILSVAAIPWLNEFTGKQLQLAAGDVGEGVVIVVAIVLFVGAAAGGYPALVLSRFRPARVLRNGRDGRWRSRLRSSLVIAQFTIALILISGMAVVLRQVDYARQKELGFDKERLVVLPMNHQMRENFGLLKDRLTRSPHVHDVTASNLIPSSALVDHIGVETEVDGSHASASLPLNPVDHDFVKTYGMELVAGRDFSAELAADSTEAFILNESAVSALGWKTPDDAVGNHFVFNGNSLHRTGTVIGVVRDFHFESIRERISPLVLFIMPDRFRNMTVRTAGAGVKEELAFLKRVWTDYEASRPFSYTFIDQNFGALYTAELRLGQVFGLFAGLAVVIACLGLFGLAAFVTERRKKEIGIRKALGASVASIVMTLTSGFLSHLALALIAALPATYVLMRWWLAHFAYHIDFSLPLFVAGGLGLAVIAFAAVGYQSIRTAVANPVASLHDE